MSQEAIAARMGYHRTYWVGIERGERNLPPQSVENIADKLEIEPLLLLEHRPDLSESHVIPPAASKLTPGGGGWEARFIPDELPVSISARPTRWPSNAPFPWPLTSVVVTI